MAYDDDNTQPATTTPQPATPPPEIEARGVSDAPRPTTPFIPPPGNYDPNMLGQGGAIDTAQGSPVSYGNTPVPAATPTPPDVDQHMSWIGRVLDKVATALGGDQTYRITKKPDGSVEASYEPSTEKEKWGRIAAAVLGGAAQGLANSQGPGGLAKAAAAGTQYGLQQPQQLRQDVQQQVDFQNKQLLAKANRVALQQKIITQTIANKELGIKVDKEAADAANSLNDELQNSPWHDDLGLFPDMDSAMKAAQTDPQLLKDHAQAKHRVVPEYNKDGSSKGFHVYNVDPSLNDRRNTTPLTAHEVKFVADEDGLMKPTYAESASPIPVNGTKMGDYNTSEDAVRTRYLTGLDTYSKAKKALQEKPDKLLTNPLAVQYQLEHTTDPAERARLKNTLDADQKRRVQIAQQSRPVIPGLLPGAGAAAAGGTTGEDYLKAAVDPSMWNQVRTIARGDTKMPTAGNRGANQALRNAVMNYDPTYTDARYDTRQNFKDKKDADRLSQLSTALEHLERLTSNVDYNPLLPYSDKATAYKEDIKHFTQESGTYIKNGVLTQGEYDDLMKGLSSNIPSVREAAAREKTNLLGGKVRASFQKYRAGAGNDIPVTEFFDPDTQARLTRYGLTGGARQPTQPAPATPAAPPAAATQGPVTGGPNFKAMTPPPNEPAQPGKHYGMGPKGLGWYR